MPVADAVHRCPACEATAWEQSDDRVRCSACRWEPGGTVHFQRFRQRSSGRVAAKLEAGVGATIRVVVGGLARRAMRFAVRDLPLYAVAPSPHRPELHSIGGRSEAGLSQGSLDLRIVREDEFRELAADLLEDRLDGDWSAAGSDGARRIAIGVAQHNAEAATEAAERFTHQVSVDGQAVIFDGWRAGEAWALSAEVDGVHLGICGRDPEPYPAGVRRVRLGEVG